MEDKFYEVMYNNCRMLDFDTISDLIDEMLKSMIPTIKSLDLYKPERFAQENLLENYKKRLDIKNQIWYNRL